jgi:hypothetical protein
MEGVSFTFSMGNLSCVRIFFFLFTVSQYFHEEISIFIFFLFVVLIAIEESILFFFLLYQSTPNE